MLNAEEFQKHDAVGLAELRASSQVSAVELLQSALQLADKLNPALNAIVYRDDEAALKTARRLDKDDEHGRLTGVPFLIKEVNAVAGWPHTRSMTLYRKQISETDSRVVQRYRSGGLVPFGSTNTPELCLTISTEHSLFGPCKNPHSHGHSAGGSSGGAAAAVAAGIVPAADASDGGGSIRVPAACCGLIGLKPSRGLTVVEPDMGSAWSGMSVSHVVTRSVRDSAAFLDLLKLDRADLFALPAADTPFFDHYERATGPLKIAFQTQSPDGSPLHPDCLQAAELAARQCESLGHHVEPVTLPINYQEIGQAMSTLIGIHVAQIVRPGLEQQELELDQANLSESARRMATRGFKSSAMDYLQALDVLKRTERQMAAFHQQYNLILSPVLTQPPVELGWLDMNSPDIREYARRYAAYSPFTALFNGTGQPSISLPLHKSESGLPIGVMFSAAWGQDLQLLQLANSLTPELVAVAAS
ncbi:amidase [Pseudohongiella spirulinae]|uniref:Amidase n=1 Tax=Pseudohongiella spirulinae TaxID=1249552 RepID=A0A0S2KCJ0_9GAMM|nr:amidase family protein [Pseudohongiella spirulinae]ALO46012.1 amidase [Pseudohongiella spirulinae]